MASTKKKEAAKPCGLCIKLEKDLLGKRSDTNGGERVLGYFDRVHISSVKQWLDYSPRISSSWKGGRADSENQDDQDGPISAYPIKLLFPPESSIQELEKCGFNYGAWRECWGDDGCDFSQLIAENPCMTLILVNLTDEFKGDLPRDICDEQLARLAKVIWSAAGREGTLYSQEDISRAHCCILPSLGYSDYCILLAEKKWSLALPLMDELRRTMTNVGKRKKAPVLSTDYIMPIYRVAEQGNTFFDEQSDLQLSVRINLWPGVSIEQVREQVGDDVSVYQLSGASDCLLVSKDPRKMTSLLCELVGEGEKNVILNMAVTTEGMLSREIKETESECGAVAKPSTLLAGTFNELDDALREYSRLLQKGHRHTRQFHAIHQRVTLIKNICGECHNESIQRVMQEWLPAFTACLQRCTKKLNRMLDKTDKENKYLLDFWRDTEEALNCFIDQVGSFIADLSRSDCFFFESEQYDHPSVGSATALLIAYNRWQNSFVRDVVGEERQNNKSTYPFLVRSGGCDSTHTTNLFVFLTLEEGGTGEDIPLISQMSEMSLFDCAGAVFRMTHECMHYCGRRYRQERVDYVIDFVSCFYGRTLCDAIFDQREYQVRPWKYLDGANIKDPDLPKNMEQAWQKARDDLEGKITKTLREALKSHKKESNAQWKESDYISSRLREWFQDQLAALFSCYSFEDGTYRTNTLVKALCRAQQEAVIELYKGYDVVVRKAEHDDFAVFALERRRIERATEEDKKVGEQRKDDRAEKMLNDSLLERTIIHILNQFLIDVSYAPGAGDQAAAEVRKNGLDSVLAVIFECFSECFADMEACLRLKAELPDYILSFVYENWDINTALSDNVQTIFRIPAVLRLCFPNALSEDKRALNEGAREALNKAAQGLVDGGLPEERIDLTALTQRIDFLLKEYAGCPGELEALEGYLRLCKRGYRKSKHRKMDRYAAAFRKLREYRDSGMPVDDTAEMFTTLTTIGGKTGEPKKQKA